MFAAAAILALPGQSEILLGSGNRIGVYGDLRTRFESDWDSRRLDGTERTDRHRIRIRARAGLTVRALPELRLGIRLRSGRRTAQQSPHLTVVDFSGNPRGPAQIVVDRWFVDYRTKRFWAWGGRNLFPFWKPNELFWDEDVTLAGVAAGFTNRFGRGSLAVNGSIAKLPDGAVGFGGDLGAIQVVYSHQRKQIDWTFAGGVFRLNGAPDVVHLRNGNGERDYTIWTSNAQAKVHTGGPVLTFGFDLMHNSADYSPDDADPFTARNFDQTNGYSLHAALGELERPGDWAASYHYARIETLAVNASFAQDDWIRWGAGGQTDASGLRGHEIRFAYALASNMDFVARLYLVEAIATVQDGKRFRLDYNIRF